MTATFVNEEDEETQISTTCTALVGDEQIVCDLVIDVIELTDIEFMNTFGPIEPGKKTKGKERNETQVPLDPLFVRGRRSLHELCRPA
ncbi:hypothetical protein KKC88_03765 [Patescibacteria group bacterium]|nr:hypothetical protein [Patescibacteria group bacterium]MBU1673380.1 hypothetical protein [Patescibacteria group bacterium]MBU1963452.1 hypothetical protein [Patescibacteria group bacterium]